MLSAEEIALRREQIAASPDLRNLLQRLTQRAEPLLLRTPPVPEIKAMLTADGGVCPRDGGRLEFDPWKANEYRCPSCGEIYQGARHDAAWAHYQHLWLAERAAHLAALGALGEHSAALGRADQLLQAYRHYGELPNRDNVLGPSRLFFSTYLESIWINNYLAAAVLLRETGALTDEAAEVVSAIADEAANLIGEFDEGFSNRQTWHNAALAAIAVWFEDEELATRAIQGPHGVLAHLLQGFGADGMWFEGENYHLFALRGELLAMGWARQAGVDLLGDPRLCARLSAALCAPALSALPDGTFPARKDSRFGVSLAQPMYLELWEVGLARLEGSDAAPLELWSWLEPLYSSPAPAAERFESYLHEAGEPAPRLRTRADLSWWSLLEMAPRVPTDAPAWRPDSVYLEGQGLAVLRAGDRYVSLECGPHGGGHGHPDRLNLTLYADGEYWLPDFGTGSYLSRDLFWYRSTLAHNAPRLNSTSQTLGDATCENFEENGSWAWARGHYGDCTRTIVAGADYVLDVLELAAAEDQVLELPLHLSGRVEVHPAGRWTAADLSEEFVQRPELYHPGSDGPVVLRSCGRGDATIAAHLLYRGELLRALAPGAPGTAEPAQFYLVRERGRNLRVVTLFESGQASARELRMNEGAIEVVSAAGTDVHLSTVEGWEVRTPTETVRLAGGRRASAAFEPLVRSDRPLIASGSALPLAGPPALDGTLEGFDTSEPLELDHEDQYRRSEEPYDGPEEFSARAYVNWTDGALYLAVEVIKPEVFPRDPAAPPLRLDNEPDEIHADGLQVYLRPIPDGPVYGLVLVPSTASSDLLIRPVDGTAAVAGMAEGSWQRTEAGYTLTARLTLPDGLPWHPGAQIGFDLLVNRMSPGRVRREGQLVWSGGGGWVWLKGDRQDPARFGTLLLR